MDPNACWTRLLNAINDNNWDAAADAADDLEGWMGRGGFPPTVDSYSPEAFAKTWELIVANG